MPYKRIASRIGVSASSVYAWTKDIELTEEQKSFNPRGPQGPQNHEVVRRLAESWAARCRAARLASQEDGRRAAREGNRLHQAGCMRIGRRESSGVTRFSSQTPTPTCSPSSEGSSWRRWQIERDEIVMSINVYTNNGKTIEEIERYWLDLLELPASWCESTW